MNSKFSGTVKTEWLPKRKMRTLDMLSFTDKKGRRWVVPAGTIVDGASIPRFLWRIIGSPFVGKYRRSSVIHDYFCSIKERPSKEVHCMFHEAMLCDEVSVAKAKAMYYAVAWFGPHWS